MKNKLTLFIQKTKYYVFVISILLNIYPAIKLNPLNIFALGWCSCILVCSLVNDDIL